MCVYVSILCNWSMNEVCKVSNNSDFSGNGTII